MQDYYYDSWNDADQAGTMYVDDHYKEVDELKEQIGSLENQIVEIKQFLSTLLHPEELGYAVTQEVRTIARNLLNELGGSND